MKLYQIRVLNNNTNAIGVGLPIETKVFFQGVFLRVEAIPGSGIWLGSVAEPKISRSDLKAYKYEDCRIPTSTTGADFIII